MVGYMVEGGDGIRNTRWDPGVHTDEEAEGFGSEMV